jgi:hypothetical protein
MNSKNFALLVPCLIVVAAVFVLALPPERPSTIGTGYDVFQAHRNTWALRRPANYAVNIDKGCYCPWWSVRTTVAGNDVRNVEFRNKPNDPSVFSNPRYYPRDIDTVFEVIEAAYKSRAYKIEVAFDETYGYPVRALIDDDRDTLDDEQSFEVSKMELI